MFISSLFDSMISLTFDKQNHLDTVKKLLSNNYFKVKTRSELKDGRPSQRTVSENSQLLTIEVPAYYIQKQKSYKSLFEDMLKYNCICLGVYTNVNE